MKLGAKRIRVFAGQKFNRLTITDPKAISVQIGHKCLILCKCECGTERLFSRSGVVSGKVKSCGCWRRENGVILMTALSRSLEHPPNWKDLTGNKFGKWTVLEYKGRSAWLCRCDCGTVRTVQMGHLRDRPEGTCWRCKREALIKILTKHGMSKSSEYGILSGVLDRCFNKNNDSYHNYGGRGVTVCEEWRQDFMAFYRDVGPRPSLKHSLDRWPDKNGNYEPGNVRWATAKEQGGNTRACVYFELDGRIMTIKDWSREVGLRSSTQIRNRLERGWSLRDALTLPVGSMLVNRGPRPKREPKDEKLKSSDRLTGTPEYKALARAISRCHSLSNPTYRNYGARGISVCDTWKNNPVEFYKYIGPRPSNRHSLDRFPDKNGNYEPGNVRWATSKEQNANRRACVYLELDGRTMILSDWAKEVGLRGSNQIRKRLKYGWTLRQALTIPAGSRISNAV